MANLKTLQLRLRTTSDEMRHMLDTIDADNRDFDQDEQEKWDGLERQLDRINKELKIAEKAEGKMEAADFHGVVPGRSWMAIHGDTPKSRIPASEISERCSSRLQVAM